MSFSTVSTTATQTGHSTPDLPLRFRDNPACAASECFLMSLDLHLSTSPKRPRIYINPQVNVGKSRLLTSFSILLSCFFPPFPLPNAIPCLPLAYTPLNYLFHTRLTHLTLVRPWRVVWEDWIAHRWFGWVSDRYWLKMDKCASGIGWEGIVKGVGCANRAV